MSDLGASASRPGSREPDPQAVPALTGFDPSRYEGKPLFFGGPDRKLIDSFWTSMVARIDAMSQPELRDFVRACHQVSPINCAWYTYRIAMLLFDEAVARIRDSDGSPKGGDSEAGSVHDSAGRQASPNA